MAGLTTHATPKRRCFPTPRGRDSPSVACHDTGTIRLFKTRADRGGAPRRDASEWPDPTGR
ncbi:hypothetical protein SALB1_1022 [Salinisphaera sp. LB1]|nr:hypothetical protein SALB1_1022 [Salinisphaera sp. LB1]